MKRVTEKHIAYIISLEQHGKTTPNAILADAKQPESPIHELYDWNIERAAESAWLNRTREIIRLVRYIEHTEMQSVKLPRYVRDPDLDFRTQGYTTVEALRVDPQLSRRALITEFERVTSVLRRARGIALALALEDEIDDLLARVAGLQRIVTGGGAAASDSGEELHA